MNVIKFGAWQVDYALVVLDISACYHALCPPISLFLIIVLDSSLRLAALLSADTGPMSRFSTT